MARPSAQADTVQADTATLSIVSANFYVTGKPRVDLYNAFLNAGASIDATLPDDPALDIDEVQIDTVSNVHVSKNGNPCEGIPVSRIQFSDSQTARAHGGIPQWFVVNAKRACAGPDYVLSKAIVDALGEAGYSQIAPKSWDMNKGLTQQTVWGIHISARTDNQALGTFGKDLPVPAPLK